MTFNQEYIKQLAEGSIILQHTKQPKDRDLLNEIAAMFGFRMRLMGDNYFYLFGENQSCWDAVPIRYNHLKIIPLHDFVSPTKDEKQTIDTIDARLKELEGLVKGKSNLNLNELELALDAALDKETPETLMEWLQSKRKSKEEIKYVRCIRAAEINETYNFKENLAYKEQEAAAFFTDKFDFDTHFVYITKQEYDRIWQSCAAKEEQPKAEWKPKVGEWVYVESFDTYILVESIDDKRAHGYNQNQKDPYHVLINGLRPATEEEIGNYLIGLAKQRYKTGNIVECLSYIDNECIKKDIEYYWQANILWGKQLKANGQQEHIAVYEKGKWAEVLPQAKEGFDVDVKFKWLDDLSGHYYIRVGKATGFTKEQAEKYAETIKNALNG